MCINFKKAHAVKTKKLFRSDNELSTLSVAECNQLLVREEVQEKGGKEMKKNFNLRLVFNKF
jgi:hypothetical protein